MTRLIGERVRTSHNTAFQGLCMHAHCTEVSSIGVAKARVSAKDGVPVASSNMVSLSVRLLEPQYSYVTRFVLAWRLLESQRDTIATGNKDVV